MGVDISQKTYMDIAQTHTRGNQIRAVMTAVQQTETDDLKYCDSLTLKDHILTEARDWIADEGTRLMSPCTSEVMT